MFILFTQKKDRRERSQSDSSDDNIPSANAEVSTEIKQVHLLITFCVEMYRLLAPTCALLTPNGILQYSKCHGQFRSAYSHLIFI